MDKRKQKTIYAKVKNKITWACGKHVNKLWEIVKEMFINKEYTN